VLAVDIPSGLDCDTGEPLGPTVKATHTATFVAHKKGFLNPQSREWTGHIHVIDIGAPRVLIDEYRQRRTG
jgi:NAD(P)H-hydrate epimerase